MRKENTFQVQFSQTSYNKPQTNHERGSNPGLGNLFSLQLNDRQSNPIQ